jgi:chromosome segregation ATPase
MARQVAVSGDPRAAAGNAAEERMIDESVLSRFRAVVAGLHAATGAVRDAEQRRNDSRHHVARLRADRDRLAAARFFKQEDRDEQRAEVGRADRLIAEAEREAERLAEEHQRLQRRRDAANQVACGCRDLLIEKFNLPPSAVGF